MPARLPVPVREIIDLLSSPPLPQRSPAPITTRKDENPLMSSPLPPSPSVMFSAFAERAKAEAVKARETQGSEGKMEKTSIWDTPDDPRKIELPPPATKNKRASKATVPAPAGVKKPRARKATDKSNVEKKIPLRNEKIKGRVVKTPLYAEMKSKYFPEKQQSKPQEKPPDTFTTLDPVPEMFVLAPKSPNQGPHPELPLHVTRRQWTPVKDTVLLSDSSPSLANSEPKITRAATFSSIIDAMRYSTELSQRSRETSVSMETRVENVLVKKRAIEMIGLLNSAAVVAEPSILKLKAPKQKRKTITDQATAAYRTVTDSSLLQNCLEDQTPITEDRNSRKPPSRKPGSPAKKKLKSDTETVILSPTGARKRFNTQEFVFGTCSQLERADEDEAEPVYDSQPEIVFNCQNDNYYDESSPPSTSVARRGFLKTLAKDRKGGSLFRKDSWDIKNRVIAGHGLSAAVPGVQVQLVRQREGQPRKIQGTGGMLWNAAARDSNGGVLGVEFVDMTGSDNGCLESKNTQLKEDTGLLGRGAAAMEAAVIGKLTTQNDTKESCQSIGQELQMVDETAAARENDPLQTVQDPRNNSQAIKLRPASATLLHTTNPNITRVTGASSRSISSSATTPSVASFERQPNLPDLALNSAALKLKKSNQPKPAPTMPDFQSYHVTRLKVEIAKFGFKDMKTKGRMVSCLERCWEAQTNAALRSAAQPEANDSGPVANTAGLSQRDINKEETVSALHLRDNPIPVPAPNKPRARAKQKKTEKEKTIPKSPKSPKRKAALKRIPRSPKAVPQFGDANDGTLGFMDLSAEPSPPKRKYATKVRPRKASVPPPSPKSAALKHTQLHHHISKVVRESGRTGSKFSFYHSILMYDPIILEDMTSWLNSTFDHEKVDVEDVKTWCEANGVCCVRSESLRAKRRKR